MRVVGLVLFLSVIPAGQALAAPQSEYYLGDQLADRAERHVRAISSVVGGSAATWSERNAVTRARAAQLENATREGRRLTSAERASLARLHVQLVGLDVKMDGETHVRLFNTYDSCCSGGSVQYSAFYRSPDF